MIAEYCSELAATLARYTTGEGVFQTPIAGLLLARQHREVIKHPNIYNPSICVVAQGRKRMHYGQKSHTYDASNYLINSLTLPVETEVLDASPSQPYLGLVLNIDRAVVSGLMMEMDKLEPRADTPSSGDIAMSSPLTERLQKTLIRLLRLLDDPLDQAILAPALLLEAYYEVLRGPHGQLLRNCVTSDARANRIAPIVHYIEKHFHEPLDIQSIASYAGMSPSALHEHFKEATSVSPMQFVKSLRLHRAHLMLLSGNPVSETSFQVGYNSPSQFSREFRRFFGYTPSQVNEVSGVQNSAGATANRL